MFSNYSKYIFIILIPSFFIPTIGSSFPIKENKEIAKYFYISNTEFYWPVPDYTRISSHFGKRISPTVGASSFHQGIDIPAPTNANLVSPINAIVTFIGFNNSARLFKSFKKR